MTTPALVFWAACIIGVTGLPLLAHWIWLRQWKLAILTISIIATNAIDAMLLWQAEGRCLLPHPAMIEYHRGMILCPGQSTMITIEMPASDRRGL